MKYALDASVAAFWVLPSRPFSSRALQLRDDYLQGVHELIAPSHFPIEVASAMTKAERCKLIAVGDAFKLTRDILGTPPILFTADALFDRAIDLSSQTRSAFYDCLYVALAEAEGCEFVTADDKLVRNLRRAFPFITPLASLP